MEMALESVDHQAVPDRGGRREDPGPGAGEAVQDGDGPVEPRSGLGRRRVAREDHRQEGRGQVARAARPRDLAASSPSACSSRATSGPRGWGCSTGSRRGCSRRPSSGRSRSRRVTFRRGRPPRWPTIAAVPLRPTLIGFTPRGSSAALLLATGGALSPDESHKLSPEKPAPGGLLKTGYALDAAAVVFPREEDVRQALALGGDNGGVDLAAISVDRLAQWAVSLRDAAPRTVLLLGRSQGQEALAAVGHRRPRRAARQADRRVLAELVVLLRLLGALAGGALDGRRDLGRAALDARRRPGAARGEGGRGRRAAGGRRARRPRSQRQGARDHRRRAPPRRHRARRARRLRRPLPGRGPPGDPRAARRRRPAHQGLVGGRAAARRDRAVPRRPDRGDRERAAVAGCTRTSPSSASRARRR